MRVSLFYISWLVFFSFKAQAGLQLIGGHVQASKEQDYSYLCKINNENGNSAWSDGGNVCSGTLISPTQVITAAHCFGKENQSTWGVSISCGGKSVGYLKSIQLPPESAWIDEQHPVSNQDFAIITLEKPTVQNPLTVARLKEDYFTDGLLKEGIRCQIAGFGYDDHYRLGGLNIATPEAVLFRLENNQIIMSSRVNAYLKTSVDEGDSGGALICTNQENQRALVGVTVAYRYEKKQKNRVQNIFSIPGFLGVI